ncbi:hypothetical protein [Amycolatopsis sp. NPDC051102]|uniref:hypothetical protein n=1 Tax=Amycolatopsis sp. NPDC051102 TaxID=3155163 RepID=UPI0034445730
MVTPSAAVTGTGSSFPSRCVVDHQAGRGFLFRKTVIRRGGKLPEGSGAACGRDVHAIEPLELVRMLRDLGAACRPA